MATRVLLVGAGRMALRHLSALAPLADEVVVVDPREEARAAAVAQAGAVARVDVAASLDEIDLDGIDAAVLSASAAGRLGRVRAVAARVPELFVEKPLEQSRAATRALVAAVEERGARAVCHHWMRMLPVADELRNTDGDVHLAVTGGAYGVGCNGIHWIDLAVHVSGSDGELRWGELDPRPIASGRGPQFRDYGGRAVFGFGGSTLYLASDPVSSAPFLAVATTASSELVLDLQRGYVRRYARDPDSAKPPYLYGADYEVVEDADAIARPDGSLVGLWLRSVLAGETDCGLPTLSESLRAHELLFDLLETGGGDEFPIT